MEMRVARKRSAATDEPEEGSAGRSGRTGLRLGLRAQTRAGKKAALEEAEDGRFGNDELAEEDLTGEITDEEALILPSFRSEARAADRLGSATRTVSTASPALQAVAAPRPGVDPMTQPAPGVTGVVEDDDDEDEERGPGGRRRGRRGRNNGKSSDASNYVVADTVSDAQMRPRHYGVIALFLLCVIVPAVCFSWYLWTRAVDQYESDVGFGSRTEEAASTFDFLGALGGSTQTGSKDMDILNQFIISQELVSKVDADLDLKAIWSKAEGDPLYAFKADGTIEDLVAYWQRMVLVNYDNGTGLMNLRVFAFDPQDARNIADAVLRQSTDIINDLSKTAQEDTTRYSKESLQAAEEKLTQARLAVLDFQVRNNIVDPSNVVANQLSVISTLNQQLASAQIDFDMLNGTVPDADLRLASLSRRLEVIRKRIEEEQAKVGASGDSGSSGFAKLVGDFEKLKVEQDFAQQAYLSALAAHDQALTDARQKTRYLAAYVVPTLAEASTGPNRPLATFLVALIGFLSWAVMVLTYYALRDRR